MNIHQRLNNFMTTPAQRKFYHRILDEQVLDPGYSSDPFEKDRSYFEIRLSQMFLRDQRQILRDFIPFCIAVSEFIYDGGVEIVPFFVGNQRLKSIEKYIREAHVEYRNERVAGPIPYAGDDVSLFLGLFRTQVNDLVERLFNFLEAVISPFDSKILSTYIGIAQSLRSGITELLGTNQVEFRFGNKDVFIDRPNDFRQFREGYFAHINCPEAAIDVDHLWVKDGTLHLGKNRDSISPFMEFDFCLVRIERRTERSDYTTLPFYRLWNKTVKEIADGRQTKAKWTFLELCQTLAQSSDITQSHRYHLIQLFKAHFEKEIQLYNELHGFISNVAGDHTRGRGGTSTPQDKIQKTAYLAKQLGQSEQAVKGLIEIKKNWHTIPDLELRPESFQLSNEILSRQLRTLEAQSTIEKPDPADLADAMAAAALSTE